MVNVSSIQFLSRGVVSRCLKTGQMSHFRGFLTCSCRYTWHTRRVKKRSCPYLFGLSTIHTIHQYLKVNGECVIHSISKQGCSFYMFENWWNETFSWFLTCHARRLKKRSCPYLFGLSIIHTIHQYLEVNGECIIHSISKQGCSF